MRPSQSARFCDSQSASGQSSQEGVASGTPTYVRDGTDGESGCERANLSDPNARASERPRVLAYVIGCRYCGGEIYLAICRDGKWRSFDTETFPAALSGVWAWRKTWGMEEQELVRGKRLHYCAEYDNPNLAPWDRGGRR